MVKVNTGFFYFQNIEEELDLATEAFLDGEACMVDSDKKEVCCVVETV